MKPPSTNDTEQGNGGDDFLGDWGKHLVKDYGLSVEAAESLELEAAELYAHDTRDGWCCACEADQAFMEAEIAQHTARAVLEALKPANEILRSAWQISVREAEHSKTTNWESWLKQLANELRREHILMYPDEHKDGECSHTKFQELALEQLKAQLSPNTRAAGGENV